MSRLDKLQISGIRSFGPEPEDVGEIKFQTPLTLILGQNGCGKTTIIEALKFAICSEQPPNSRSTGKGGSAFVHDPKLNNASETLAQIKLRIFDINNKSAIVCRSMKNIQKLKNMEFKKLDQTIVYDKEMISNRCIDTDEQMCYLMGVSKPILNYVIFCHQEESSWPMEEGKKVKERFDHIFDADKYNKCLEKIRSIRNTHMNENKLLGKDVEFYKINKDTAMNFKEKLEEVETRLVASENTIEACARDLSVVEEKLKVVKTKEMNIAKLLADKTADTKILESLKKDIAEIVKGLPMGEFQGSDEDLEDAIKSFNLDFEEKKKKLLDIEDQIKNLDASEKLMQNKLSSEQVKLGKLKRDQDAQREITQQRNEAFNKLAMSLSMSDLGTLTPSSQTSLNTSMEEVEAKIRDVRGQLEAMRVEADGRERQLQDDIDSIRKEQAQIEQTKKIAAEQLQNTKSELRKLTAQLDEVGQSSKNLTALENRLKRVMAEMKAESDSVDVADIDAQITTLQTDITGIEDDILEVNKEIDDLIEVSNLQTSLDSCVERKASIDAEVNKLRAKTDDILKHLLKEIPENNVKSNLDLCLSKLTHNIASTQKRISEKQTELTRLESKRQHLDEKLRSSRQTLIASEEELQAICLDRDYERVLADTADALKSVQDDTGTLRSSMVMYRKYIEKLQVPRPCCPLCIRSFNADQEAIELAKLLESKLKDLPGSLASKTEEQGRLEEKLSRLQQLRPVHKRLSQLTDTEIPQLSDELSAVSSEIKELSAELAAMENDLEIGLKQDHGLANSIQVDVITLDQKRQEARALFKQIETLTAQIPATGSNLQQSRSKREELQTKLELSRKSLESIQTRKTKHVNKINQLTTDQNEIVKEQLKVEKGVQQMKQLLDKKNELKELETSLADQIEKLSNDEFPIKQKLETAEREKNEVKRVNRNKIETENNKMKSIDQQSLDVERLNSKVLQFERQKIAEQLEQMEREIGQLTRTIDSRAQAKLTLLSHKDIAKADINNHDARHRDLNDNKNLRRKRGDATELERKLNNLETNIGDLELDSVIRESSELEIKYESLKEKKNQAYGTKREIESKIKDLKAELAKPIYKNAMKDYKDKLIDFKVNEAVIKDLGAYYLAMDWALKKTHTERMKTINVIIRDLWRKIYVGNDIDYIEIKTSEEETKDADKRRVFNYRVVQVKNGIELDMRGRCSAGQKILASIIIRLALAETFSTNCGVITLDEPTTNLDRDNIASLCTALINLVVSRATQKHFQLIIITHDEEFISRLTREEKVRCFWRVYRDDKGLSKIVKCDPNQM